MLARGGNYGVEKALNEKFPVIDRCHDQNIQHGMVSTKYFGPQNSGENQLSVIFDENAFSEVIF